MPTGSLLSQWGDWFRLVYLRRRFVLAVVLLVFGVSVWSIVVAERRYDAGVTIYIAPVPPNVVQYQQVVDNDPRPYREDYWYGTQYALLRSQSLLRRVADRLHLWDDEVFLPPASRGSSSVVGWVRASLGSLVRLVRSTPSAPFPAAVPLMLGEGSLRPLTLDELDVVTHLGTALSVTPLPETRLVRVLVRAPSPNLAHDIALALASEYIDYDIDHRTSAAREAVGWIAEQIRQQEAEAAEAESAVVVFRSDHPGVPLGDDTVVDDHGLVELQEDLNAATTVRIARRAAYRQVVDAAGDPARLLRLPALTAEPALQTAVLSLEGLRAVEQRLGETFGDLHPELIAARADVRTADARLARRVSDVVAGLSLSVDVAEQQESTLRGLLRQRLLARVRAGRVTVEHASLVRAAAAAHSILASLTQRMHETQVMAELRTTVARITEPPVVPGVASVPRVLLRLQLGLLIGFICALGLVVLLDQLDACVRTPDDIGAFFDLPTFAMLPYVEGIGAGAPGADEAPVFQAAVQTLRTRLLTAAVSGVAASASVSPSRPVFVLVTSAEPGDGKSVVVTELAASFARARRSVLVVDADLRRGCLHERFGVSRGPGLSEVVRDEVPLSAALRRGGGALPDLLPTGVSDSATELLQQFVLDGGLGKLDLSSYHWVFIDVPPVLPVPDALLLARAADLRLFVVDSQQTPRSVVRTALDSLASHGAPAGGVILNKLELERHPRYYGRYYRSYQYYGPERAGS